MKRLAIVATAILAACAPPRQPAPITPAADASGAPVVRRAAEPVPAPPPTVAKAKPALPAPQTPVVVPADTQYVCVTHVDGERRATAIEFAPKVAQLCRKHPEMGPCQYERNICRRSGGRVYAEGGVEITLAKEAEYDRKVMRVRLKAN